MGAIDQPTNPPQRLLSATEVLAFLETVCERLGLDAERTKMMRQIFIFGEPMQSGVFAVLPDVSTMRIALETVQTWFNAGNLRTPALDANLLMYMNQAGYPIASGTGG